MLLPGEEKDLYKFYGVCWCVLNINGCICLRFKDKVAKCLKNQCGSMLPLDVSRCLIIAHVIPEISSVIPCYLETYLYYRDLSCNVLLCLVCHSNVQRSKTRSKWRLPKRTCMVPLWPKDLHLARLVVSYMATFIILSTYSRFIFAIVCNRYWTACLVWNKCTAPKCRKEQC